MAQRGKLFKVQFRQDLILNAFQNIALAESYRFRMLLSNVDPPQGPLEQIAITYNLDKSADPNRTWSGPAVKFGTQSLVPSFTILNAWEFPGAAIRLRLNLPSGTLIYEGHGKIVGDPGFTSNFFFGQAFINDVVDPSFIYQQPGWSIEAFARGYDVYNP